MQHFTNMLHVDAKQKAAQTQEELQYVKERELFRSRQRRLRC